MHCYVALSDVLIWRHSVNSFSLANQGPAKKARPVITLKVFL